MVDDPGLRQSMVAGPADDEVMTPEEESLVRKRLEDLRAGREPVFPFEPVYPDEVAHR